MREPIGQPDLALMFSGGGARAAYQVGFLRLLAREFPDCVPGILTGVSAGGINAAYLAARLKNQPVKDAVAAARRLAAVVVQHPGAIIAKASMPDMG
jgi:predicted acylesterase/phospholipase RssA